MPPVSTKERILNAALELFSQKGFDAVSVEQIAQAVGIKAPSLYKHFASKQAIFEAILAEMQRRYDARTAAMKLHFADADSDVRLFADMDETALICKVQDLVRYALHDPYVSRSRRLLTIEQYRDPLLAQLYTERYMTHMLVYHEKLFTRLIEAGVLRPFDPYLMAMQYVAPIYLLLSLCDRQPEKEPQAMDELAGHIRQFRSLYSPALSK